MFHYFFSDDSKQYAATNTAHSKNLIECKIVFDVRIKYNMGK